MKSLLERQADGVDAADVVMREELKLLLDAIRELDAGAYTASPDAAGLLAKYYRRVVGEPAKALEVYREALKSNADSYYLADLVAQTELELGDAEAARANFRRALEIIERLNENNIWSHATAATACVGLADIDRARKHLEQLLAIERPSRSVVDSIARGIREVAARMGVAETQVDDLLHTLDDDGAKAG